MKSHEIHGGTVVLRGPRSLRCFEALDKSRKSALSPAEFAQGLSLSENRFTIDDDDGVLYSMVVSYNGWKVPNNGWFF